MSSSLEIQELFKNKRAQLLSEFDTHNAFSHSGVKGTGREHSVRRLFETMLPERYGLVRGQVAASTGELSPEVDLIVFDKVNSPVFLKEEDLYLVPVEGAVGVIEVKSVLTSAELDASIAKAHRVKALDKNSFSGKANKTLRLYGEDISILPPISTIFAFDSQLSSDAIMERLHRQRATTPPRLWVDYVYVVKGNFLTIYVGPRAEHIMTPTPDARPATIQGETALPWLFGDLLSFYQLSTHLSRNRVVSFFGYFRDEVTARVYVEE